ncbi:MAG: lyase [Planctomycetota bacterium]
MTKSMISLVVGLTLLTGCALAETDTTASSDLARRLKGHRVSAATVKAANTLAAKNWYRYTHEKSAHTTGAFSCGKTFAEALAAWQGRKAADRSLMKQIRFSLRGDRCLVAAGGYGSQHERAFTASCVLLRHTSRLWNQLNDDEKTRMDLLMKAALVASAYTTSDAGNAEGQNTDLMGRKGLGRGWNPNFREGMIGMMIVGTAWLGGAEETYAFLNRYDHQAFTATLREAGLDNTARTFAYAAEHPDAGAPAAAEIERDIRDYTYKGTRLDEPMKIYWLLTRHTYGGTVNTGLNGGEGIDGAGRMVSGADALPNVGKPGMLYEFDARDGRGKRSSITYAYGGFRPNLMNQVVLIVSGHWREGAMADECLALMRIGVADLFYKLDHGYISYANGKAAKPIDIDAPWRDFKILRAVWDEAVAPAHGLTASR